MAQSILIFDFGKNEEAAQQARHKIESWKQAFRLGTKISMKFERTGTEEKSEASEQKTSADTKNSAKKKTGATGPEKSAPSNAADERIKLLVRLDFSDHEKLSYQRWLDRIPAEEPFKSAKSETARQNDESYAAIAERFDSLD